MIAALNCLLRRLKVRSFANDMLAAVAVAIAPLSGPAARAAHGEATFAEQIAMRVDRMQRRLELSRTPWTKDTVSRNSMFRSD